MTGIESCMWLCLVRKITIEECSQQEFILYEPYLKTTKIISYFFYRVNEKYGH